MNLLKAYYYVCADILKEHMDYIPELVLTNAKTYQGKAYRKDGRVYKIALSKWNLDTGTFTEQEDIDEIIDTICHEFAHMYFWNHNFDHTEMTKALNTLVESELKIRYLQKRLEVAV